MSKSADLVKTTATLGVKFIGDESVRFTDEAEDQEVCTILWSTLSHQAWEDMGEPNKITVTVEPGDKLN